MLVLGSSLTVAPANDLPRIARDIVIVNLQRTPLDSQCSIRIFAKIDELMELLMKKLELEIPEFDKNQPIPVYSYQPENPEDRIARKPSLQLTPDLHQFVDQIEFNFNEASNNQTNSHSKPVHRHRITRNHLVH